MAADRERRLGFEGREDLDAQGTESDPRKHANRLAEHRQEPRPATPLWAAGFLHPPSIPPFRGGYRGGKQAAVRPVHHADEQGDLERGPAVPVAAIPAATAQGERTARNPGS